MLQLEDVTSMKCHRMSTCQQFSRQDRGCPHRASINSPQRLGKPAISAFRICSCSWASTSTSFCVGYWFGLWEIGSSKSSQSCL